MKPESMLRAIALFAGAALLSTGAMAAGPKDEIVTRTATVKYSPSSAATTEGARMLYQKLRTTADRVCGEAAMGYGGSWVEHRTCVTFALDKAVQDVGIPMVEELHAKRADNRTYPRVAAR